MAASAGTRAPDSNRLDMAAYDTSGIDPGHALAGLCGSWGGGGSTPDPTGNRRFSGSGRPPGAAQTLKIEDSRPDSGAIRLPPAPAKTR